jgi:glycosyltransferase involved in cell wall biosynthesis
VFKDEKMSISVVVTCFNEEHFIEAAIQSVLLQTRQNLINEIIIHDDGSNWPTLEILRRVAALDSRIKIIYGKGNGVSKGRNLAVAATTGEWIAFLDGDDVWAAEKLEKQYSAIAQKANAGFVYSGIGYFRNENKVESAVPAKVADLSGSRDTVVDYFLKDGPITSTVMCRRSTFNQVGGYDEQVGVFEDTEFYARVAAVASFLFCSEMLVYKRVHGSNITGKRKDLMFHHERVARICAEKNPRLYPLIARRLAGRARKLGNVEISEGDKDEASRYYKMAVALYPYSISNIAFWVLAGMGLPMANIRSFLLQLRRSQ